MGKQHGLGQRLLVSGNDLSSDIKGISDLSSPVGVLDKTDITQSGRHRMHGQFDGMLTFDTHFDDAALKEHLVLRSQGGASPAGVDRIVTFAHRATIGATSASMVAKQIDYAPTRDTDGDLTQSVQFQGNGYGLEWGKLLTAIPRTDTSATDPATGVDMTGNDFGLQAYLHVTAFSGTDVTISLEESSEVDGAVDTFTAITGGAFTALSAGNPAPFSQRIQTARDQTIERYIRVVTNTSAGFTSVSFVVQAKVNVREMLF
jgi:hypothetical protein